MNAVVALVLFAAVSGVLASLVFRRVKLYLIVQGTKVRVGTLTTRGRVKEYRAATFGSLFGTVVGHFKDKADRGASEVWDVDEKRLGEVDAQGRVQPAGEVRSPADRASFVFSPGSDDPIGFVRRTGLLGKEIPAPTTLVAKGGAALLLLFGSRYRNVAQDIGEPISKWDLCFLASIIFVVQFLFTGRLLLDYAPVLFPFLGKDISFVVASVLVWAAIWGVLTMYRYDRALGLNRLRDVKLFGFLVPSRLNRRTGIKFFDVAGLFVCLCLTGLFFLKVFRFLPLGIAGSFAFLSLLIKGNARPWPVYPRRTIPDAAPGGDEAPGPAGETVERKFSWGFQGISGEYAQQLTVRVRAGKVAEARVANPSPLVDSARAIRSIAEHPDYGTLSFEVRQVVRHMLAQSKKANLTIFEEATNVLNFIQNDSIPYALDSQAKDSTVRSRGEYFRYPLETLFDQEGDCDCKAILAASIFSQMGFNTILLISGKEGHAAVAVEGAPGTPGSNFFSPDGKTHFYWCETTADKTYVGALPPSVNTANYTAIPISAA